MIGPITGHLEADPLPELQRVITCPAGFIPSRHTLGHNWDENTTGTMQGGPSPADMGGCSQRLWFLMTCIADMVHHEDFKDVGQPHGRERWRSSSLDQCMVPERRSRPSMSLIADNGDRDRGARRLKLKLGTYRDADGRRKFVHIWAHRFVCWAQHGGRRRGHRDMCLRTRARPQAYDEEPQVEVMHTCHNGECLNPLHMRWGSREENLNDRRRSPTRSRSPPAAPPPAPNPNIGPAIMLNDQDGPPLPPPPPPRTSPPLSPRSPSPAER